MIPHDVGDHFEQNFLLQFQTNYYKSQKSLSKVRDSINDYEKIQLSKSPSQLSNK